MITIIAAFCIVLAGFLAVKLTRKLLCAEYALSFISLIYLIGLVYFTLLSRLSYSDSNINLVPFYTIMRSLRYPPVSFTEAVKYLTAGEWTKVFTTLIPLRTAILNILLFMPLGYIIPEWREGKLSRVLLCCLIISCSVEIIQLLFGLGWCDVDDLLCNIAGGIAGYILWKIIE